MPAAAEPGSAANLEEGLDRCRMHSPRCPLPSMRHGPPWHSQGHLKLLQIVQTNVAQLSDIYGPMPRKLPHTRNRNLNRACTRKKTGSTGRRVTARRAKSRPEHEINNPNLEPLAWVLCFAVPQFLFSPQGDLKLGPSSLKRPTVLTREDSFGIADMQIQQYLSTMTLQVILVQQSDGRVA